MRGRVSSSRRTLPASTRWPAHTRPGAREARDREAFGRHQGALGEPPAGAAGRGVLARAALGVDRHHDALRAVLRRRGADHVRVGDGGGIEAGLVRPGVQQPAHVFHRAHAAAHGQRDEDLRGHRLDDVEDQVAAVAGGRDVQEGQFVGALLVVAGGDLHRVAGIAQPHPETTGAFTYSPATAELAEMLEAVAKAYGANLVKVTDLIHSRVDRRAQQFADAFRWRKDS